MAQLVTVSEQEGYDASTLVYVPKFFSDFGDVSKKLFELDDFRGKAEIDTKKWEPPRLHRWSHVDAKPFHKAWKPELTRWQHVDYTDWLLDFQNEVQKRVEELIEELDLQIRMPKINSVGLNRYEDGNSSIHLHQDCIPEFGTNPTVILASFGGTRVLDVLRVTPIAGKKFVLNEDEEHLNHHFPLDDGSLFIMAGSAQTFYAHQIAKVEHALPRISCVFREHKS